MTKNKILLSIVIAALMLTMAMGCGEEGPRVLVHPDDLVDPTLSIVFGYIDTSKISKTLDWVHLLRKKPPSIFQYIAHVDSESIAKGGLFFNFSIPIGQYQINLLGLNDGRVIDFRYLQNNPSFKKIKKPGVYYMGSYKLMEVDRGQFTILPTKRRDVTEKKLLEQLLSILEQSVKLSKQKSDLRYHDKVEEYFSKPIKMIKNRIKKISTI